jgi:thiol-disulfide isomerase/thioredoxin
MLCRWLGSAVIALFLFPFFAEAQTLPKLQLNDLQGRSHELSEYAGKILVLNFWATWCGPCREEMPMLNELARKYEGRVAFLTASLDDEKTRSKIPGFLASKKIDLSVWTGATTDHLDQLELGGIVPATILFDRDGTTITKIMGEARKKELEARLDWALNGHPGKPPKTVVKHY